MLKKLLRRQVNLNSSKPGVSSATEQNDQPHLVRSIGLMSLVFLCVSNTIGSGKLPIVIHIVFLSLN